MSRQLLRQGIREHWAAKKKGTRLEQKQTLKKIGLAAEREVAIMLETMNLYGKDPSDVVEALEIAETLAAGEEPVTEPVTEVVGLTLSEEPPKKRRGTGRKATLAAGEKPKRGGRRKKAPGDDGGHPPPWPWVEMVTMVTARWSRSPRRNLANSGTWSRAGS
jgi:hypothetical protein